MKTIIVLIFFLHIKINAGAQLADRPAKEGPPVRNYVLHLGATQVFVLPIEETLPGKWI